MKFSFTVIVLLFISSLAFAQKSSNTGRTEIDEEAFNTQLEKCKVDTNNSPNSDTKKTSKSHSSEGTAQ